MSTTTIHYLGPNDVTGAASGMCGAFVSYAVSRELGEVTCAPCLEEFARRLDAQLATAEPTATTIAAGELDAGAIHYMTDRARPAPLCTQPGAHRFTSRAGGVDCRECLELMDAKDQPPAGSAGAGLGHWWTIAGEALMAALLRCENGEAASMVFAELWANSDDASTT